MQGVNGRDRDGSAYAVGSHGIGCDVKLSVGFHLSISPP